MAWCPQDAPPPSWQLLFLPICFFTSGHRKLLDMNFADLHSDHKLVYWIIGALSSLSLLIESKSRRSELALYALPKGVESIYHILSDHNVFQKEEKEEKEKGRTNKNKE